MPPNRLLIALLTLAAPVVFQASAKGQTTPPPVATPAAPGLLVPPTDIDPGMTAKPPSPPSAMPMPVIPPPGAAGNPSPVQPK